MTVTKIVLSRYETPIADVSDYIFCAPLCQSTWNDGTIDENDVNDLGEL